MNASPRTPPRICTGLRNTLLDAGRFRPQQHPHCDEPANEAITLCFMASAPVKAGYRLRPPPLPRQLVARPEVRSALLATQPGSACVITAAPGYGATTAVVQAVSGSPDDICWLSLDSTVSDRQAADLLAATVGSRAADLDTLVATLTEGGSAWVIVDGLDPAAHPTCTTTLAALAERLPGSVRLVVTASHDLGWSQARNWDESLLEFDDDEALELMSMIAGEVDIDDATEVLRLAQGWVSALVAAAAHLRVKGSPDRLKAALASQLLSTWFDALPPERKEFLEQTAILDLLGEGPAERITGRADVAELLTAAEQAHCYVRACAAPEHHTGRWWRRHPLLTALLRQRTSGLDVVAAHEAAASWFAQTADVYATMQHMLAAGRYNDAATYLNGHEVQLLSTGHAGQVLQWYAQLAETRAHEIDVMVRSTWGMVLARDIVGADAAFARLHAALTAQRATADATAHNERLLAGWAGEEALLEAYLAAYHGDPATVVSAARRAIDAPGLEHLEGLAQLAPILVVRGLLWAGRADEAEVILAKMPPDAGVNPVMRELHLAGARALMHCAQGRILDARRLVRGIQSWSEASGIDSREIQVYAPSVASAWVDAELGRLDVAEALAGSLLVEVEGRGHLSDATWSALILCKVQVARGDYGAALRSLAHARELAVARTPASELLVPVNQQQALVHMATGDFIRADRIIRQLPPSSTRVLLAARAGIRQQPARARRLLDSLDADCPRIAAERHILLAAIQAKASRRLAQGHLRQAAAIAHENGLQLLLSPPEAGISELVTQTELEFHDESLAWLLGSLPTVGTAPDSQVNKLSRGELQLLTLLPTRAKNVDIAEQLGVSVNTVKTRLRRLYAKLGAGSRDQAIVNARTRGLLD